MTVRAKFKVTRIERSMGSKQQGTDENGRPLYSLHEMQTITLSPVYGNGDPNHENTKFWAASPSGEIKLGTVNQAAWEQFILDREYYVDFTPAE